MIWAQCLLWGIAVSILAAVLWYTRQPKEVKRTPKDPNDFTWSARNSTQWEHQYYCANCGATLDPTDRSCGDCGQLEMYQTRKERSYRRIWSGDRWLRQYRLKDDTIQISQVKK